ncbi:MAG TPA: periplasmic heavy metal sensor [Vicinamibacterales bacterium]|nr:periplasmic heavy metal sensor [Vicinamibacterales bacterium]
MARFSRLLIGTAAAVALAAGAALAQAQAPAPQPQTRAPRARAARLAAQLNLTDAQREQIRKVREDNRVALRDQTLKLRDARRALQDALYADAPDQGTIDTLKSEIAQLTQQVEARRLEIQEEIARIYTPEQRQILRERRNLIRDRQMMRNPRPGRGPGAPGGRLPRIP